MAMQNQQPHAIRRVFRNITDYLFGHVETEYQLNQQTNQIGFDTIERRERIRNTVAGGVTGASLGSFATAGFLYLGAGAALAYPPIAIGALTVGGLTYLLSKGRKVNVETPDQMMQRILGNERSGLDFYESLVLSQPYALDLRAGIDVYSKAISGGEAEFTKLDTKGEMDSIYRFKRLLERFELGLSGLSDHQGRAPVRVWNQKKVVTARNAVIIARQRLLELENAEISYNDFVIEVNRQGFKDPTKAAQYGYYYSLRGSTMNTFFETAGSVRDSIKELGYILNYSEGALTQLFIKFGRTGSGLAESSGVYRKAKRSYEAILREQSPWEPTLVVEAGPPVKKPARQKKATNGGRSVQETTKGS
ncbi:MAG: hypothetical protein HY361_03645 [Candidatus Aenigmarchaeota archaeon]|nr:hypothetical protein [Candidatus Aenigmarchaeota archaeon]